MRRLLCTGLFGFFAVTLGLSVPRVARAQHGRGGGMGMSVPRFAPGGSYAPRDFNRNPSGLPPRAPESAGTVSSMRGGLQLGPPGRWWDDKHFAKDLKLRPDQQQRMDAIFEANRSALLGRLGTVQQEQMRLEAMTHTKNPDEGALNAQIDRLWQSLAELEKAKTHYLLQIRQEMDPDQLTRLEEHR